MLVSRVVCTQYPEYARLKMFHLITFVLCRETITSLCVLQGPLVATGTSMGQFRVFDGQNGEMIASHLWHQSCLKSIFIDQCNQESLMCTYEDDRSTVVVMIERYGEALRDESNICFQKWRLERQITQISTLPSQSQSHGCSLTQSADIPGQSSSLLTSCPRPLAGFSTVMLGVGEGAPTLSIYAANISDSAGVRELAGKVKSSVLSFAKCKHLIVIMMITVIIIVAWLPSVNEEIKQPPQFVEAKRIPTLLTINDSGRQMTNIIHSPLHRLTCMSDRLGRVWLMDAQEWEVLRVWKGARDAQMGFMLIETTNKKHLLVLAIYYPKHALVEYYLMRRGVKIYVDTKAPKDARLLSSQGRLLLIDCATGDLARLSIPLSCLYS